MQNDRMQNDHKQSDRMQKDHMQNGRMQNDLFEELGLTKTETQLYLALLETGPASAGTIIEKSGLPNSTVHRDLNALITRGIVTFLKEGRRRTYAPSEPEHFLELIDDRRKRFQELLPELKKRQRDADRTEFATIYKGVRGIKEVYSTMISKKGEYNTFGGGPVTAQIMGFSWWLNLHKRRVANKLRARQVFDESVRRGGREIARNPLTRIRYLDRNFAQFQETVIAGDCVAIAVFSETPYAFLIRDKAVAESYRKHFELLWSIAKP